ncbi:MAG: hypothetical protein NNA25_09555 [Nitrospira sp.]|nr:hypothetical protein [Nitrospira sp.]
MKRKRQAQPSGKTVANLASLIGLLVVWTVVWANLPSREELLAEHPPDTPPTAMTELDLTIPGVVGSHATPNVHRSDGGDHRAGRSNHFSEKDCLADSWRTCTDLHSAGDRSRCETLHSNRPSAKCRRLGEQREGKSN